MDRIELSVRLLALAMTLYPVSAVSAPGTFPWNIPENVRIVQKAPADGARTFTSVTAALGSITNASATNRFVVKVLPGTYEEVVVLPPYVTLEGSGQEATTLTTPAGSSSLYTVSASNETRIENMTVTYAGVGGCSGCSAIVSVEAGARVLIERAKLAMPPAAPASAVLVGADARLDMRSSNVVLANGTSAAGDTAIDQWSSDTSTIRISDSRFEIEHRRGNVFVAILASGPVEVVGTVFDLVAANGAIELYDGNANKLKLHACTIRIANGDPARSFKGLNGAVEAYNTTLIATGNVTYAARLYEGSVIQNSTFVSDQGGLDVVGPIDVRNSTVGGPTIGIHRSSTGPFRAANSQLIGGHDGVAGVDRVTNCVDGNYNAIPNL